MVHAVRNVTVCYVRRNCVHHKNQNLHCKMYVYVIYLVGIVSYILSLSFQVFSFRISIFLSIFLCTDMQRSLSLSLSLDPRMTHTFFLSLLMHSQPVQPVGCWLISALVSQFKPSSQPFVPERFLFQTQQQQQEWKLIILVAWEFCS